MKTHFFSSGKTLCLLIGLVLTILASLVLMFNNSILQQSTTGKTGLPGGEGKVEEECTGRVETERNYNEIPQHSRDSGMTAELYNQMWNEVQQMPTEQALFNTDNNDPWICLGPFGEYFPDYAITYAGRIKDIEPPTATRPLRVAAASGGLWEYQNMVPVPLSDNLNTLVITTFVTDPLDDDHIIVGTGEFHYNEGYGSGIWQTFDRGESWSLVSMNPIPNNTIHIQYSPGSTSVLHAATTSGYYQSNDNGTTWTLKHYGPTNDSYITDVSISSANPNIIYIGKYGFGVYKSTDGGNSFSLLSGTGLPSSNIGRISLEVSNSNPNIVYVCITAYSTPINTIGIFKTTDNGNSWNILYSEDIHWGLGNYCHSLGIDPVDPDIVYVGGVRLLRTFDGGQNWVKLDALGGLWGFHQDHHVMAFSDDGVHVYDGNDGGISYSSNHGATWGVQYNHIPITQFYHIDVDPSNGNIITGGTQDNGVIYTIDRTNWYIGEDGDGFGISIDPNNLARQWGVIGLSGGEKVVNRHKTLNHWNSSVLIENGIEPPNYCWWHNIRNDFVDPVYLYTNNGKHIYWSTDYGDNWSKMNTTPFGYHVGEVTVSRWEPGGSVVYACLYKSDPTWNKLMVFDNNAWHERFSNQIYVDLHPRIVRPNAYNSHKAYLVMDEVSQAYPDKKVFKTDDRGISWTNITSNLPNIYLMDIIVHPNDDNKMYLGSKFGCFRSLDGGNSWHRWNLGLPEAAIIEEMVFVDSLALNGKFYIVAGTHGRGIWMREVSTHDSFIWIGSADNNWHNTNNWLNLSVPGQNDEVIIRDAPHPCWIYASNADCKQLTVEGTAGTSLRIYNKELHVHGNMTVYGELVMDNDNGVLTVEGNVNWESGSQAHLWSNSLVKVYGDWNIQPGANHGAVYGTVAFMGSNISKVRCNQPGSYFHNVRIQNYSVGQLLIDNESLEDIEIKGKLEITLNSIFNHDCQNKILLEGDFINAGYYSFNYGTLEFNGNIQNIENDPGYTSWGYLNHVIINATGSVNILNKDLDINGTLTILNGTLDPHDHTIYIAGSWNNQIGPQGFNEGNGTVVFDGGNYSQECTTEKFNILSINKASGNYVKISGYQAECNQYDWEAGGLWIMDGEFTANDLTDNGIFGNYVLLPGAEVNLSNYNAWVDLNGSIEIIGGTMNIYGGTTPSYWPYAGDASIAMYGGVLNFHNQGIRIYNSSQYTLTENIVGGTIRVAGGFQGETGAFTPQGGTMEFYGTDDQVAFCENGCHLYNVLISKGGSDERDGNPKVSQPLIDPRSGEPLGNGIKSNTLNMTGFLDLHGDMIIDNGILNTNGYNMNVGGNWTNNVGDAGFIESSGTVSFNGPEDADINTGETFYNFMMNKSYPDFDGLEISAGEIIHILGNLNVSNGTVEMNDSSGLVVEGDLFIGNEAGINAGDGDVSIEIEIGGHWTNENSYYDGIRGFTPGGETVTFFGMNEKTLSTNCLYEEFNNLVIDRDLFGSFRPYNNIRVLGDFTIITSSWWDYIPGLIHEFHGDFTVESYGYYVSGGTSVFAGNMDQNLAGTGVTEFNTIIIDKPGNSSLLLNRHMAAENGSATTVQNGTLNLNGMNFLTSGNLYVNGNGKLHVPANSGLLIQTHLYVTGNGRLETIGTVQNPAYVGHPQNGHYGLEVTNGGSISAEYTHFEDMNSSGIKIYNGGVVDENHAFNNCVIDAGQNSTYAIRLRLYNNQILTCTGVDFPNNPIMPNVFNVGKSIYEWGHVNFVNATGNFAGQAYEADPFGLIDWTIQGLSVNLKVFLEGPFNGPFMNTTMNAYLPLNQPFNPALPYFGNMNPDWYYTGSESVQSIPNSNVVEWILIELRDALNAASATSATIIARQPAFLLSTGQVVALDGVSQPEFSVNPVQNLFVVIWQRNHIGIMSANPLPVTGGVYSYDFSSGQNQVYGGNSGHKLLSVAYNIWGLIGGDGNADGQVNNGDKNEVWVVQAGTNGYKAGDFTLDAQVNNGDKIEVWIPNTGLGGQVPADGYSCKVPK